MPCPEAHVTTAKDVIECLLTVRDAVGPNISIFVDALNSMNLADLPIISDAFHALEVPWFEDPADASEVELLASIRKQSKLPVVSGETLYSKQEFLRLLDHKAADILNLEITNCGILGTKDIAALAETYSTLVSIHNDNTITIGLAASMQVAAVIPNFAMVEHFPRLAEDCNTFSTFPVELDSDGCIPLSHEPGFGVTVNEAALVEWELKDAT